MLEVKPPAQPKTRKSRIKSALPNRRRKKVKIGNWSEDMELEAAKLKTYLLKKDRGALKCSQV